MSTERFPHSFESAHPQFLWNNQEFIIRMLNQNKIGIGINESGSSVIVYLTPGNSLNFVANGGADFPLSSITKSFDTSSLKWIYLKADTTAFTESGTQPVYNNYLHGWYDSNGNRAVVFINPDQPAGYKAILMDTFNYKFQYDMFIHDTNYIKVMYDADDLNDISIEKSVVLEPGNYRFEMRGGKGGDGGSTSAQTWVTRGSAEGGKGIIAKDFTFKIKLNETITVIVSRGGNGNKGDDGNGGYITRIIHIGTYQYYMTDGRAVSGGGGSSGEDSRIMYNDKLLFVARGGAGGGGASAVAVDFGDIFGSYFYLMEALMLGPGGGGAGSGTAEQGGYPENSPYIPTRAQPGNENIGGIGGRGSRSATGRYPSNGQDIPPEMRIAHELPIEYSGKAGQNIIDGFIRNGGDSGEMITLPGHDGIEKSFISKGGTGTNGQTSGKLRIVRTR